MDLAPLLEDASISMCGVAIILWMSIGTLSSTRRREVIFQRVIAALCIASAFLLIALHYSGGNLWGSRNIARPFAVISVIVALASMMNIKGKDIQGEANPHSMMKSRRNEE